MGGCSRSDGDAAAPKVTSSWCACVEASDTLTPSTWLGDVSGFSSSVTFLSVSRKWKRTSYRHGSGTPLSVSISHKQK